MVSMNRLCAGMTYMTNIVIEVMEMDKTLRKITDEELWARLQSYITAAGRINRELERRQNEPLLKVVRNKNDQKEF